MEAKETVLKMSTNLDEITDQIDICNAKAKELIKSLKKLNSMKLNIKVNESGFKIEK